MSKTSDSKLSAPTGMRAHEDADPTPVSSLPRITGLNAGAFVCDPGEHGDRRRRGVGHLRAQPAVLDRVVGRVAGGEHPPAGAGDGAVLVDRQEAVGACARQSADRRAGDARHRDDPLVLQLDALRLDEQPPCGGDLRERVAVDLDPGSRQAVRHDVADRGAEDR